MTAKSSTNGPKFCSECGTQLHNPGARFCHECGSATDRARAPLAAGGTRKAMQWGLPAVAVIALIALTVSQRGSRKSADEGVQLSGASMPAPDISSMSPEERANRLYDRVMRLNDEGKKDSAAFFAPMVLGAIEALAPLDAHRRYDLGVIELVTGALPAAKAQADTILKSNPTHLLALALAARVADARKDASAAAAFRKRLVAAEPAERARGLPEYADHANDVRVAGELAKAR
jgi:hypothetical protein